MLTMMNSKNARRFIAIFLVVVMGLISFGSYFQVNVKAETKKNVSVDDIKKSIENVIKSVDELKDIIKPETADSLEAAFTSFFEGAVSIGGTAINVIDGATTFLMLIGVMKDAKMNQLLNISEQLKQISDKLEIMDKKLDEILSQMTAMQAEGAFKERANRAVNMNKFWVDFETEYMENQMDSLMRQYESALRDRTKLWIENRTEGARQTDPYDPLTSKVVLFYPDATKQIEHTLINDFDPFHARSEVATPDPYTLYADEFFTQGDVLLILDETFLPQTGEIVWNVNTYRNDLKDFFSKKLYDLRASSVSSGSKPLSLEESLSTFHYKSWNNYPFLWTDEEIEQYANDAADAIIYRINWYVVNQSADFSAKVRQSYTNFCNHMIAPQEGMSALLQSFFLSHAFEYEIAEDLKAVINQMLLKTGVYSMFAMNVLGFSVYATDDEKQSAADTMCSAIDSLKGMLDNSITGCDNYCYVTNSIVDYGEAVFSSSVDVNYKVRGQVASYLSYSGSSISPSFTYEKKVDEAPPSLIGDANALLIAYHLASKGLTFDQAFMEQHLTTQPIERRSAVITSMKGEQSLPLDGSCVMKSHRAIGGWFNGNPIVTMNGLPSGCTSDYIVFRRGMNGSLYTGGLSTPEANKMLLGIAVYGESHWYWEKDECAVMGGPCRESSFKENLPPRVQTDISFWGDDYYRQNYSVSTAYNMLVSIPTSAVLLTPGPYPLSDLVESNASLNAKMKLEQLIQDSKDTLTGGSFTEESKEELLESLSEGEHLLSDPDAASEEIDDAIQRITNAHLALVRDKASQQITVHSEPQSIYETDLSAEDQILNGVSVDDVKGKVLFELSSVSDPAYASYFEVEEDTCRIFVKQGLPAGTYTLTIRISSPGNDEYAPVEEYAELVIHILEEESDSSDPEESESVPSRTITFDLNGGSLKGETGIVTRVYEEGEVFLLPEPERAGYTFDYWEGSRYEAGEQYTVKEDHTFVAQWIRNEAPSDPDSSGESDRSPKTGDPANAAFLAWLMLFSLFFLFALVKRRSHT